MKEGHCLLNARLFKMEEHFNMFFIEFTQYKIKRQSLCLDVGFIEDMAFEDSAAHLNVEGFSFYKQNCSNQRNLRQFRF